MQSKDPAHSSTVFDLPPRETEALAARELDGPSSTLTDTSHVSPPTRKPASKSRDGKKEGVWPPLPEQESFEGPSFEDVPYADDAFANDPVSPWSQGALDWSESDTATSPNSTKLAGKAQETDARPASSRDEHDKALQLGLGIGQRDGAGSAASARNPNFRRPHVGRMVALTLLVNLLTLAGAGYWLHRHLMSEIEMRHRHSSVAPPATVVPSPALGTPDTSDVVRLNSDMARLLQRLNEIEERSQAQNARVDELSRALTEARKSLAVKSTPSTRQTPAVVDSSLPPTQSELVLLKERNRLTGFADECIATGAREPYTRLWEAMDDPRLAHLVHAARSEILRVQNFYLSGSRLERYDIPVATYFPEDSALKDSQLKESQLIELLQGKKHPWEVRVKAAFLLGTRRSIEVGDALVKAVKHDDNLDVVKEATFSFEQMTGYRARIFDAESMEGWWMKYKATPTPPASKNLAPPPKSAPAPAKSAEGKP
jgi:hypothetical protein